MKRPGKRRSTGYSPLQTSGNTPITEFPLRVNREVYPRSVRTAAAPDAAPNIVVVVLGDIGFGVPSAFGGLVETATFDRLARGGLRYCRFHTTGVADATRSVLLTGRNHGATIPAGCSPIAEVLRQNGYATGWWGRCDTIPATHTSEAGPFDRWPTHIGFEHFYGVFGGDANQFFPALFRDTSPVDPPRTPEQGYHLTTDLATDCVAWGRSQKAIAPGRPLFVYFAPPAAGPPHQPPSERRGRHAGRFSFGWDEYRRRVFERQLELGVIPRGARLTERPPEFTPWTGLSDNERALCSGFFENYADCVEHADAEVGRIVDALEEMAELENTLVIYVAGDRGCGADGGMNGTLNVNHARSGGSISSHGLGIAPDHIGRAETTPYMPVAWSWAGVTPFQSAAPSVAGFGATRTPLVLHWPRRILAAGGLRHQFHHVTDLAATILEVVGIRHPEMVNGVAQRPLDGIGMSRGFAADRAGEPSARRVQHFVNDRSRGIYLDGWFAGAVGNVWGLYDLANDYSQSANLAEHEPHRLRTLQDRFIAESARGATWHMDNAAAVTSRQRIALLPRMTRVPESCAPQMSDAHTITATIDVPRGGAEGVIVSAGGEAGGWALYAWNRRLVYHYNFYSCERTDVVSDRELPVGHIEVKARIECEANEPSGRASVALLVDGELVGRGVIPRRARTYFGGEGIDVGVERCSPVSAAYRDRRGFPFTGVIEQVTLEVDVARGAAMFESRRDAALAGEPTDVRGPVRRS
jgi:arylsulfatase